VNDPADDAGGFQLAQLLREHLLRDARDRSFQVREAQDLAPEEMKQDLELPAPLEDLDDVLDASSGGGRRQGSAITSR